MKPVIHVTVSRLVSNDFHGGGGSTGPGRGGAGRRFRKSGRGGIRSLIEGRGGRCAKEVEVDPITAQVVSDAIKAQRTKLDETIMVNSLLKGLGRKRSVRTARGGAGSSVSVSRESIFR
jgi:hypothetical protein